MSIGFLKAVVIPYIPVMVGLGLIFALKSTDAHIAWSFGLFLIGIRGILRIMVYRVWFLSAVYSKSRLLSDSLFVLLCWGWAIYAFVRY
jgi:hypothetical protein